MKRRMKECYICSQVAHFIITQTEKWYRHEITQVKTPIKHECVLKIIIDNYPAENQKIWYLDKKDKLSFHFCYNFQFESYNPEKNNPSSCSDNLIFLKKFLKFI